MNEGPDHPDHAKQRQGQVLLFPQSARKLCEGIGLNWWAALKLHTEGWLSFNPENTMSLDEAQEHELRFVGSLVTGGCNPQLMTELLSTLERPYCYDGRRIYYNWAERSWRLLPAAHPEAQPESVFAEWLDTLKSEGDFARLEEIKAQADEALKSLRSAATK